MLDVRCSFVSFVDQTGRSASSGLPAAEHLKPENYIPDFISTSSRSKSPKR
jgi:hypothetical protein